MKRVLRFVMRSFLAVLLAVGIAVVGYSQYGSGGEGITSLNLTNGGLGWSVNNNINVIRAYVKAGETVTFHVHKGDVNGGMGNDPATSGGVSNPWHITIYSSIGTPTETATYSPAVANSNDYSF